MLTPNLKIFFPIFQFVIGISIIVSVSLSKMNGNAWRAYCNIALTTLRRSNFNNLCRTYHKHCHLYVSHGNAISSYVGQSDPSNGIFGAGAHSKFGLITLLATYDILGLQVRSMLYNLFYDLCMHNLVS